MSRPTLRNGSRGQDVKDLQSMLAALGYSLSADGVFGRGTEAQVKKFQEAEGLGADGIAGKDTWAALENKGSKKEPPQPLPMVLKRIQDAGHDVVWEGDFHLNLFGIRTTGREANKFDDVLGCAYTENGIWKVHVWPGTCDPGTYWLENPSRVDGTAILVAGQYKDTWKIDLHGGKYEALCQRAGKVRVYRDSDKDDILDMDTDSIAAGWFGINIHRSSASGESTQVNKWSAGCQVHATLKGFQDMMDLAHKQVSSMGRETFTYTLLED